MLQIYYAEIQDLPIEADACPVSAYRREQLQRIRNPLRKRQSIGAELLLIHALSEHEPSFCPPAVIAAALSGKPYLLNSPWHFSISHSGRYAACAIADEEIGLDLQVDCSFSEQVSQRCFTEEEREQLRSYPDIDYAFCMLWTLKESYLKALGTGLRQPMRSFSLSISPGCESASCANAMFWHGYRDGCHFSLCRRGDHTLEPVEMKKVKLLM